MKLRVRCVLQNEVDVEVVVHKLPIDMAEVKEAVAVELAKMEGTGQELTLAAMVIYAHGYVPQINTN